MSGSVSPLTWTGNKGCIYTTIDAFMPPHRTYVEACMGSAEVFLRKKPVEKEIINDYNGDLVRFFRVLQRNENLERLIGRLFLSFNSEQIFRANKVLLAEVPNILDDLTETSVIIENTQWNDFDLAVAFYENQVFSFSSTGKNFAITKKDMTKRFGRLIAACARLRNATEMIASNKEWEFAGLYADEGISGTRADKRPQFQKMIEDCHKGKIDMIITKSVSRFARNTVDCLDYVRSLKEIGVGIYFEEQNIDTLKSDSELYLVIYAGFAQSESESISKNITWTHRKNFEDGKPIFMYSRMLGYRKGEDGNPEIVPEEAAIVQRVFDMYLSGKSTDEISEILQAEKIVIPGKKLTFSKSMIIRMLKNEKYCGDAILQKTVTIDPISKKRKANEGEAPMWLVENSHPAIVTREIFNKAQEESARRKAKAPVSQKSSMTASGKYSKYALTEVMICGECGSRYKRVTWNIRGKRRIVWRCISRLDYGKKYCTESITVDEQALQRAIVRALYRFNVEDEATYLMLMKSTIGEAIGINGSSDEIDLLERRIDALNKRMLDLVSLSVQEGDDAENHEDDFKNISTQIEQLTKRITAIRESESENVDFQARLKEIQDIIDKRRENKDIYDDSIVRQMVECIKVYHDGRLQIILGGGYELEEYLEK